MAAKAGCGVAIVFPASMVYNNLIWLAQENKINLTPLNLLAVRP